MRLTRRSLLALAAASLPGRLIAAAFGYPRLLQGPMIGASRPDGFTVWSRASGAFDVGVEVATEPTFRIIAATAKAPSGPAEDFVTAWSCAG